MLFFQSLALLFVHNCIYVISMGHSLYIGTMKRNSSCHLGGGRCPSRHAGSNRNGAGGLAFVGWIEGACLGK